jgi:hypothetical protein
MSNYEREFQKLYDRAIWRGPNGVKLMKLRRDPMCEVTGCTRPATCVDHRKAHHGDWFLFCGGNNLENLRSLCKPHHDAKLKSFEDGKVEFNPVSATGGPGRQFTASAVRRAQLDRAMNFDRVALLKDIPK